MSVLCVSKKDEEIRNTELSLIPKCNVKGVRLNKSLKFDYMFCETHEIKSMSKKCCKDEGVFNGDLKELVRYIGGGSVEMDDLGEVVRVVGNKKWEEMGKWYGDIMALCWTQIGDNKWVASVEKIGTGRVCYN